MAAAGPDLPLETSGSFMSMGGRSSCRRCRCHIFRVCTGFRRSPRLGGSDNLEPRIRCNFWRLAAIFAVCVVVVLAVILACVLLFRSGRAQPEVSESHPVLVTGATGRTGAIIYSKLKAQGIPVRGFVRNATKAREMLGCSACDASEGIFVGDIMDTEALQLATQGTSVLVIATASTRSTPNVKDVEWTGAVNQLNAFAQESAYRIQSSLVMLISSMGTTMVNPIGFSADVGHYKLSFEAELMASQLPFVIIKPCGLTDGPEKEKELVVGHRDSLYSVVPPLISRSDVARVLVSALVAGGGLRFDICSRAGAPTEDRDLLQLLSDARYHWET